MDKKIQRDESEKDLDKQARRTLAVSNAKHPKN